MDEVERKIFVNIIERILKTQEPGAKVDLSEVQETRRQALNLIYSKSRSARSYIDLCMTIYARAVMEDKSDMMIDGLRKLFELIFGEDTGRGADGKRRHSETH